MSVKKEEPCLKNSTHLQNYAIDAFLKNGMGIGVIADIVLCTEEELTDFLTERLVEKEDYVSKKLLDAAFEKAKEIRETEGAEAALLFLACAIPTGRKLTQREQDYALTLKPTPVGFEPEPE